MKILQHGGGGGGGIATDHKQHQQGEDACRTSYSKIGITNDPRLSFPGQKALEVVCPLVQLLKSEHMQK